MTPSAALAARLERDKVSFLLAQFVDIHGSPKVKMSPVEALQSLLDEGAGFAGGAVWGLGQGAHSHDMMGRIDPESYTPVPWQPEVARFACDLHVDGQPYPFCSRVNLKQQLATARSEGFVLHVGIEPEHFLVVRRPDGSIAPWDPAGADGLAKPCYDYKAFAPAIGYLQDLTRHCNALGWGVYQTDHEDANGQFEVNFKYADALTTADRYTFFKMMTSQVAARHGAIATHMAKPFTNRTGSGAHLHYHLADAASGENLFTDLADPRGLGLSPLAYHFLGGIIRHAPALCAVTSPTINCYKRLLVGDGLQSTRSGFTWTPAFISYGDNNRTQMIRVCGPGHVEDRSVSAGCNPYLAFAAYLAAGLDGVVNAIEPGEPVIQNLYAMSPDQVGQLGLRTLPQSLRESVAALEADPVVRGSLGAIGDEFIRLKRQEWNEYHRQVSPWEVDQYLTLF
jgi:glutamine synthetase